MADPLVVVLAAVLRRKNTDTIRPTMMLSSMFTKFVIPFCSMIGRAIIIVRRMKFLSKI